MPMSARDVDQVSRSTVDIRLDEFLGGVGMWGAVPAGYDTTRLPMDRGIHVHARSVSGKAKHVDSSHRAARIFGDRLPATGLVVSEIEAIYYMITTVFGITPQNIICPKCGRAHLDQDWYSVHPHQRHLCEGCGEQFETERASVGNPIVTVREACGVPAQQVRLSTKTLDIEQAKFRNGLLIWGSNPAFLWTGNHSEQEGMHVHVFGASANVPELDETYGSVRIDGVVIDPLMVRLHMAQQVLPSLRQRLSVVTCPTCESAQFDVGEDAYTPRSSRHCSQCGEGFSTESELISNPVLTTFSELEKFAQGRRQHYVLELPPVRPVAA
jgi:transposase-like protein